MKSPTGLFGVGQTDSGVTVLGSGSCQDGHPGAPYFLVTNGKTTAFNIPNSQTVSVLFVSGDEFGGSFTDTNTQKILGFTSKGGKVVTYTVPTAIFGTYVTGVNAQGEVVGFFFDSKRNQHGFNYFGKTYYKIDYYKNNSNTEIDGISSTGAIFGHYEKRPGA